MMKPDEAQARNTQLQEQGWTRRFAALGRRLTEASELYSQLGFEVLLEPVNLDDESIPHTSECEHCIVTSLIRTIYTRPGRTDFDRTP